jgi:hypothetical protein
MKGLLWIIQTYVYNFIITNNNNDDDDDDTQKCFKNYENLYGVVSKVCNFVIKINAF